MKFNILLAIVGTLAASSNGLSTLDAVLLQAKQTVEDKMLLQLQHKVFAELHPEAFLEYRYRTQVEPEYTPEYYEEKDKL